MSPRNLLIRAAVGVFSASIVTTLVSSGSQLPVGAGGSLQQSSPDRIVTRLLPPASRAEFDVWINGRGPFVFGFDTGASGEAWVTAALVRRLNLSAVARMHVSDGSGVTGREVDSVRIDSLQIGDLAFGPLRAPVLGDGPKQDGDPEAYGTLGFELFRDYLLTLDYPQNQLRVRTGELPDPDGRTVLTYSVDLGGPHIEIDMAGHRVHALIDSGNAGGLLVPRSFAAILPLRGPLRSAGRVASSLGEFDLFRGDLEGDLRIGTSTLPQPVVFFSDFVTVPNLGRNVIRNFAVTFDQRNQRVQITRPVQ